MPNSKSVFHSALLTVAMRWTDRLIGLVSMVILARLLVPADFGIVSMASIVVGLIDVLLDLGVNVALIQNRDAGPEDYDTAWTLRLIQASLAGALIYFSAPLAADYYRNPLVADVLRVMGASVLICGWENIGIVAFQKHLEFGKDFQFFFWKRIAGFAITMVAVWLVHSYWAMVLGTLGSRVVGILLSYVMHPYRPKLSLSRFSKLWSVSQWVLIRNIGAYLDARTDKLLVGRRTDAATAGAYSVADEIAALPTTELLAPLGRVLFPAFVQKRDDPAGFARSVSTAIGVQTMVAIPACVGLSMVADDVVFLLLGPNWSQSVPLMRIMAISNLLIALTHSGGHALMATGKVRMLALTTWLQASLFVCLAIAYVPDASALEIAEIRLAVVSTGALVLALLVLSQVTGLGIKGFFGPLLRPLLASGCMAFSLIKLHPLLSGIAPMLRLAIEVGAGGIAYSVCALSLWAIVGRPRDSAESYLLKNIFRRG